MAQIDDRKKFDILDHLNRFDTAFEKWLARRLPWVYRIFQPINDWFSRPHPGSTPRSAFISWIVALILLVIFFVVVELLRQP